MDLISIVKIAESIVILAVAAAGATDMLRKEKRSIREWLLLAVTEAERAFGSGTGALKLRYVWEKAREVFPLLTKFIGFDAFSEMVDDRLTDLKHILETNSSLADYVADCSSDETEYYDEDKDDCEGGDCE